MSGRLTDGFREIIELKWSEFCKLETSPTASNFDSVITALARAAQKGNLRAIQMALDRLDSRVISEIEVEYPKFYMRFPNAKSVAGGEVKSVPKLDAPKVKTVEVARDEEIPTGSLRVVLDRLLDSPKTLVDSILGTAQLVDKGNTGHGDPLVKSVIVAGLMKMVHDGRTSAVFEVFDRIDGRVKEVYRVLGGDVYLVSYSDIAPTGSYLNEDGVYELVSDNITNSWAARLESKNNNKNR